MHLFSGGHDTVLRWYRGHQAQKLARSTCPEPQPMKRQGIWVGPGKKFQVFVSETKPLEPTA